MRINKANYMMILAKNCWTSKHVREIAGMSSATFSKAINGGEVRAKTVGRIADAMNVSVDEIVEGG